MNAAVPRSTPASDAVPAASDAVPAASDAVPAASHAVWNAASWMRSWLDAIWDGAGRIVYMKPKGTITSQL